MEQHGQPSLQTTRAPAQPPAGERPDEVLCPGLGTALQKRGGETCQGPEKGHRMMKGPEDKPYVERLRGRED